jgi:sugar lactone lactonase YvrE
MVSLATTLTLRWNSTGITVAGITSSPGVGANQFTSPTDLAFDSTGGLYVADYVNNRIQKWTIGTWTGKTVAGQENGILGATATTLHLPIALCMNTNNSIFISDTSNHRVQLWLNDASSGATGAGITGR